MEDGNVSDGVTLLALLKGADHLIEVYDLTDADGLAEIGACIDAAMQDANITAELPAIAEAVAIVRGVICPPPSVSAIMSAGFALIGGGEWEARQALALLERATDQLAAVVALAAGIDPYGDYTARRAA